MCIRDSYYSMFGFQRIGDMAWAAGDMQARGFLLGGTSGRTTLNGEGLQHEDGHSHLFAATIPNCIAYDPTFGYEVAVADAVENVERAGVAATIVETTVAEALQLDELAEIAWDAVVVDPPRTGLETGVTTALCAMRPR